MPLPTLVVLVLVSQSPTASSDPPYLDSLAGELVRRARARRETVDRTIRGYNTLMRERAVGWRMEFYVDGIL